MRVGGTYEEQIWLFQVKPQAGLKLICIILVEAVKFVKVSRQLLRKS